MQSTHRRAINSRFCNPHKTKTIQTPTGAIVNQQEVSDRNKTKQNLLSNGGQSETLVLISVIVPRAFAPTVQNHTWSVRGNPDPKRDRNETWCGTGPASRVSPSATGGSETEKHTQMNTLSREPDPPTRGDVRAFPRPRPSPGVDDDPRPPLEAKSESFYDTNLRSSMEKKEK